MTHINFVWMIDFDHFPWAVSDMIRRSVGSVEALPGGTSSPSIYLGHEWARTYKDVESVQSVFNACRTYSLCVRPSEIRRTSDIKVSENP